MKFVSVLCVCAILIGESAEISLSDEVQDHSETMARPSNNNGITVFIVAVMLYYSRWGTNTHTSRNGESSLVVLLLCSSAHVRALVLAASTCVFPLAFATLSAVEQTAWYTVFDSLKMSQGRKCNTSRADPCSCSSITCSWWGAYITHL